MIIFEGWGFFCETTEVYLLTTGDIWLGFLLIAEVRWIVHLIVFSEVGGRQQEPCSTKQYLLHHRGFTAAELAIVST